MKETKVYIDELPESCGDCEFCETSEHWFYCSRLGIKLKYISREKDCPLQSLKTHDRELVNEVCEKIREHLSEQKKSLKDTFSPYSNGKAFIISAVEESLNKIEKEYEK